MLKGSFFSLTTVTKHLLMWECLLFQIPAVIDDIEVKKDPVLEGKDLIYISCDQSANHF